MSSSLKNIHTDDLVKRWGMIIDNYLERWANVKDELNKINKIRKELLLIREELLSRKIEVDVSKEEEKIVGIY